MKSLFEKYFKNPHERASYIKTIKNVVKLFDSTQEMKKEDYMKWFSFQENEDTGEVQSGDKSKQKAH